MTYKPHSEQDQVFTITPTVGTNTFNVDLDDGQFQDVEVATGGATDIIPSVSGQHATNGKKVTVRLTNSSGADQNFDWSSLTGAQIIGAVPTALVDGMIALIAFESYGANLADLHIAYETVEAIP